ncbi:MAG TPA: GNAT family N-acetyltransferase [Vicinamibacterales bacterium]|nr:GNAT family N-acetyltransferase [Vicinamibacterales bacterium]
MTIRPSQPADIPGVRSMLTEYVAWIGLDLAFQEIDAELAGLPGEYAPPRGVLLVAEEGGQLVGMIGLRPLDAATAEMKRLFVRPEARGRGLAKQLIAELLREAKAIGYDEIRLDTLPMMGDAQSLYVSLGFRDIPAYYDTPIAGTRFMALRVV